MKCVPLTVILDVDENGDMWECRKRNCPFYYEWGRGEIRNPGCHLTFNFEVFKEKKVEFQKKGMM